MQILDFKVAKAAREALKLSQAAVARDVGIVRPDLSKFENGKLILADDIQSALKDYYIGLGGLDNVTEEQLMEGVTEPKEPVYRIRDGIVVANHLDDEDMEQLLSEYHWNDREIERLSRVKLTKDVKRQEDEESVLQAISVLSRRQCALLHGLQGRLDIHAGVFSNDEDSLYSAGQYMDFLASEKLTVQAEDMPERLSFPMFSQDVPDESEDDEGGSLLGLVLGAGSIVGGLAFVLLGANR